MEVQKLQPSIIEKIRSSTCVNSINQCITEMVLNSLDARSTAVAVRINFVSFRIQVVDNGNGITKDNLNLIGQRYMTSKCNNLDQLKSQCVYYGFRGEALSSIINISKLVEITSKHKNSSETWSKYFKKTISHDVVSAKDRPSYGTTITVDGFLYNLPLRKKRVTPEMELLYIKRSIESLAILHPNISFSLRNDVTGTLILNLGKSKDIISSFKSIHLEITSENSLIKVSKNNVTIMGLLFKGMFENNYLQYIYVNKRPVKCSKIQQFIWSLLQKSKKSVKGVTDYDLLVINEKNKHPAYVINIKCPCSFVDILLSPTKTVIEFENWEIIFNCIEKLISCFLGNDNKRVIKENREFSTKKVKSNCGVSQINGVFKSYGFKRKNTSKIRTPKKMQKSQSLSASQNIEMDSLMEIPQLFTHNQKTTDEISNIRHDRKIIASESLPQPQHQNNKVRQNSFDLFEKERNDGITESKPNSLQSDLNKNLQIVDSSLDRHTKKIRCPLPVKVFNDKLKRSHKLPSRQIDISPYVESKSHNVNNVNCNSQFSTRLNIRKTSDEHSFFSTFTNDENKGKNLIMDMFLKSTQVYNSEDEEQSDKKSEGTVLELESNYFLENNVTTNINGKSKTMSMSVNITKKIKKKCKINKKCSVMSKPVHRFKKMVTRGVQTSVRRKDISSDNSDNFVNDTKLTKNHTLILSTSNPPHFKFIYQSPVNQSYIASPETLNNCKCDCHGTSKKIFNFDKHKNTDIIKSIQKNNSFGSNLCDIILSPIKNIQDRYNKRFLKDIENHKNQCPKENNLRSHDSVVENFTKNMKPFELREKYKGITNVNYVQSPYFLNKKQCGDKLPFNTVKNTISKKKPIQNDLLNFQQENNTIFNKPSKEQRFKFFKPQFQSTQLNDFYTENIFSKKKPAFLDNIDQYNVSSLSSGINMFEDTNKNNDNINELCENSLYNFHNNVDTINRNILNVRENCQQHKTDLNFLPKAINSNKKDVNDYQTNRTTSSTRDLTKIFVTLSNRQKQEILKNELNVENEFLHKLGKNCQENKSEPIFLPEAINSNQKVVNEYRTNGVTSDTGDTTKIFITLSNRQKQEILKKELIVENELCNKMSLEWDSQMSLSEANNHNVSEEFNQEWTRKHNNFGCSFYINNKTGFATFCTPKPLTSDFKLCKRFEFIPKGLSPILKEVKEVDKSLSQNKKDKLETYILESYQNELLIIKWQNYIKNNDPQTFFDEVYKEKLNHFENFIPKAIQFKKYLSAFKDPISFDRTFFNNISVIGQVDKKFIAAFEKTNQLVILFDQHAVHERIRQEDLLKDYSNTKVSTNRDKLIIFLPDNDLSLLKKHETYLKSLGLNVEFFKDGINIVEVPSCLYNNKFKSNDASNSLSAAIQLLIKEIIESIKETGGVTFKSFPKIIQNIINLEACKGAIKFGDKLAYTDCEQLLKKLSLCNLPFQCAHGRPTLTPLLSLDVADPTIKMMKPPNFKNLFP